MPAAVAGALRRNTVLTEWLAFLAQALIAVSVEVGDDLWRGAFSQHGTVLGVENAQRIVAFEAGHGFWVEPAWQLFFEHTHRILGLTITWAEAARFWNGVYVLAHVFVTLAVALWVYFYHRQFFGVLRNIIILTNIFALVIYETFPVAPPRLTYGLVYNHHSFTFQDTVYGIFTGGKLMGSPVGYNEFSAMPSVHIAWAIVVAASIVLLARSPVIKALGVLYPFVMLVAVVVTANHFLLDAAGAVAVVVLATSVAVLLERWLAWRKGRTAAVAHW